MNKVILLGRLTKEIEPKYTQRGDMVISNTLAVERKFQKDKTDFINISVFGKTAEFMEKYLKKGSKIAVVGELRVNVTESDNIKKYFTEVYVTEIDFADSGRKTSEEQEELVGDMQYENDLNDDIVPNFDDEDVPF